MANLALVSIELPILAHFLSATTTFLKRQRIDEEGGRADGPIHQGPGLLHELVVHELITVEVVPGRQAVSKHVLTENRKRIVSFGDETDCL